MNVRSLKLISINKNESPISMAVESPQIALERSSATLLKVASPNLPHEVKSATSNALYRQNQSIELPSAIDVNVMKIIQKEERTNEEAWALYQYLKEYMFFNLFINMTNEVYQKECLINVFKKFRYEKYPAGHVLFEEGDASNGRMYVVLSGSIHVMLKRKESLLEASSVRLRPSLLRKDSRKISRNFDKPNENLRSSITISSKDAGASEFSKEVQKSPSRPLRKLSIIYTNPRLSNSAQSPKPFDGAYEGDEIASVRSLFIGQTRKELDPKKSDIYKHSEVVTTIEVGGYFGERALESTQKRTASIVVDRGCELLVLTKDEFLLIKKTFNTKTRDLVDFVIRSVPGIESRHGTLLLEHFLYLFEEKTLNYKNHLIVEGASDDNCYLIYSGTCQVYRTISIEEVLALSASYTKLKPFFAKPKRVKEKIPLAIIKDGSLVGEEVFSMDDKPYYTYSVQVTSDVCKVFCINKAKFAKKFNGLVFRQIEEMYQGKKSRKDQILLEQMTKRGLDLADSSIDNLFLNCKRTPMQMHTTETVRLNTNPSYYNSYKRIVPVSESKSTRNYTSNAAEETEPRNDFLLSLNDKRMKRKTSEKMRPQANQNDQHEIVNLSEMFGLNTKDYDAKIRRARILKNENKNSASTQRRINQSDQTNNKDKIKLPLLDRHVISPKYKLNINVMRNNDFFTDHINIDDPNRNSGYFLPPEKTFSPYKKSIAQLRELDTSKTTYLLSPKEYSSRTAENDLSALSSLAQRRSLLGKDSGKKPSGSKSPSEGRQSYFLQQSQSTKRLRARDVLSERVELMTETNDETNSSQLLTETREDCYEKDEIQCYGQFLLNSLKKKVIAGRQADPQKIIKQKRMQKRMDKLCAIEHKSKQNSVSQKSNKINPIYSAVLRSKRNQSDYSEASLRINKTTLKKVTLEECFLSGLK